MEMWGENVVWILFLRRAKCCKIRLMADKRKSDFGFLLTDTFDENNKIEEE